MEKWLVIELKRAYITFSNKNEGKTMSKDIKKMLVKLREKMNCTQKQLAEHLGKSQTWMARVEAGNLRPSGRMTAKIIDIANENKIKLKYEDLRPMER